MITLQHATAAVHSTAAGPAGRLDAWLLAQADLLRRRGDLRSLWLAAKIDEIKARVEYVQAAEPDDYEDRVEALEAIRRVQY